MNKFFHFLQYHNAIPIALGIMVLGAGATFAATNPETIYSAAQTTLSIDNTYIAHKDLSSYTPRIEIVGVTEDAEYYYVAYKFSTIDIQNSVWKDITKDEIMKVSKADLGPYRDLGLYVTEQLKQIVGRETERLATTQEIERKNVTQKTVATVYGGLVGKFLDNTTEELPGYTPVVTPPPPPPAPEVAAAVVPVTPVVEPVITPVPVTEPINEPPSEVPAAPEATSTPPVAPTMQILGDNPARIPVGTTYVDLGASITGPTAEDLELTIHVLVDGHEVTLVALDTSVAREWTIRYEVTKTPGVTSFVERQVIVYEPPPPEPIPPAATSTDDTATSSSPVEDPAPNPEPGAETPPVEPSVETPPSETPPAEAVEPTPEPIPADTGSPATSDPTPSNDSGQTISLQATTP